MSHHFLSEEEIQAAEQRSQQATPGEWVQDCCPGGICAAKVYTESVLCASAFPNEVIADRPHGQRPSKQSFNNFVFIAHAHQDLPRALADVRELRRVVGESVTAMQSVIDAISATRRHAETWANESGLKEEYQPLAYGAYLRAMDIFAEHVQKGNFNAALALAQQVEK